MTYPNTFKALYNAGFFGGAKTYNNLSKNAGSHLN